LFRIIKALVARYNLEPIKIDVKDNIHEWKVVKNIYMAQQPKSFITREKGID
jgi:hypothetical protein